MKSDRDSVNEYESESASDSEIEIEGRIRKRQRFFYGKTTVKIIRTDSISLKTFKNLQVEYEIEL